MAYASFSDRIDDRISPLIPALQSNWLIAHVVTCFIGYAAFAVAGGLGLMYLIKQRVGPGRKAPADSIGGSTCRSCRIIDDLTHKTIVFGFLWLSAGIITGAVWANEAWGTYWSWDPKETWSIITWFVYASTLHARFTRGWSGNRASPGWPSSASSPCSSPISGSTFCSPGCTATAPAEPEARRVSASKMLLLGRILTKKPGRDIQRREFTALCNQVTENVEVEEV
jgi:hypothetical protein